jgi:hypothetical protein
MAFSLVDMDKSERSAWATYERRMWAMELAVKVHEGGTCDNDEICLTAEYIFMWVHHDASAGPWNPRFPEIDRAI